jgi:hypothetical protein
MSLTNGNGIAYNDEIWTWGGSAYNINTYYDAGTWDADPLVQVGEGFLLKHTGAQTVWSRYFTVQ